MIKTDLVFVVDFEATCWEDGNGPTFQHPNRFSEIIEVGLAVVDIRTLSIASTEDWYVRPIHTTVSEYCTNLTGITPEKAAGGLQITDVLKKLQDLGTRSRMWLSWGNYDRSLMEDTCLREGFKYPFSRTHINVKGFYQSIFAEELGVSEALGKMGMEFVGRPHNGQDDAINIARLYLTLLGMTIKGMGGKRG